MVRLHAYLMIPRRQLYVSDNWTGLKAVWINLTVDGWSVMIKKYSWKERKSNDCFVDHGDPRGVDCLTMGFLSKYLARAGFKLKNLTLWRQNSMVATEVGRFVFSIPEPWVWSAAFPPQALRYISVLTGDMELVTFSQGCREAGMEYYGILSALWYDWL